MLKQIVTILLITTSTMACVSKLFAADDAPVDPKVAAMVAESVEYCKATVNTNRPTPVATVAAKVKEASALLEKEGSAAFSKFYGKDSPFIYEGTYIIVQDTKTMTIYVNPSNAKMVGMKSVSLKDSNGKRIFVAMNEAAQSTGEGWADYYWPKPGSQEPARKITFVKKCKLPDGPEVIVSSGIYNFSDAEVAKLELH